MATDIRAPVDYPSSDGKPMAENTRQFQWIVTVKCGMDVVFRHDPNVFVAGDLLWYPVEGEPQINTAPDTMVVFGRPKRHRDSYKQWEEGGIAPQVVFEILSPGNTALEMIDKFDFYDIHEVEEYYLYDPDRIVLKGWLRHGTALRRIPRIEQGWLSPRLNVRFEMGPELVLIGPDNKRFSTYDELAEQRGLESQRAQNEYQRAETERIRADSAEAKLAQMRNMLRARGIDPDAPVG